MSNRWAWTTSIGYSTDIGHSGCGGLVAIGVEMGIPGQRGYYGRFALCHSMVIGGIILCLACGFPVTIIIVR